MRAAGITPYPRPHPGPPPRPPGSFLPACPPSGWDIRWWGVSLSLPHPHPSRFHMRWQDPTAALPQPWASQLLLGVSTTTYKELRDRPLVPGQGQQRLCPCGPPHSPHPCQLRAAAIPRAGKGLAPAAAFRLLYGGRCPKFPSWWQGNLFNLGKPSGCLAAHMRRGQRGPAQPPAVLAVSLPFIVPRQCWIVRARDSAMV